MKNKVTKLTRPEIKARRHFAPPSRPHRPAKGKGGYRRRERTARAREILWS